MLALQIALALVALVAFLLIALRVWPRTVVVPEARVALLYKDGRFLRVLPPGAHSIRGPRHRSVEVDLRRRILTVPGQEVLTRDDVGIKVSVAVQYAVVDAVKATHEVQSHEDALHLSAQLALRDAIAGRSADELLEQRDALGRALHERVSTDALAFGLAIDAVAIKDVMFPAELKRAFTEVLRARKEGQAALEKARGEAAALRNLANASQLLAKNPHLMQLRVLETLESASRAGSTLVLGVPPQLVDAAPPRGRAR